MNAQLARHPIAALVALVAVGFATASAQTVTGPAGSATLKWTPHRAATATPSTSDATAPVVSAPAPQPVAAPSPAPSGPPASVVLPEGVPPIAAAGRPQAVRTDRMPTGGWSTPNRIPGPVQRTPDPASGDGFFGLTLTRAPQGEANGRPILAAEGRQAAAMQRSASRMPPPGNLGGGLAPRFQPGAPVSRRPERLAMNVDGVPSVLAQAPQAGAVDGPAVPDVGRAAGSPVETAPEIVPTPPGQSVAEGLSLPDGPEILDVTPGDPYRDFDPAMHPGDGMMLGAYPPQLHVESFYDDPYEYEDDDYLMCHHSGRLCNWLRQFGRPYYGWKWYRDFTASAGITGFENESNFGIRGNFGTNEYMNWAMPFWNAFGVGWQVGVRGTQTNFHASTIDSSTASPGRLNQNSRNQVFVTTGFFTRAFEGRGLQGGAVYDYLNDNWYDTTDISQLRSELSYVWGYHEFGYWGATNIGDQNSIFGPIQRSSGVASTIDQYCAFYRLQFGDANEWKVWGGATGRADGIVGTMIRAPMARTWALEGTFNYIIPNSKNDRTVTDGDTTITFAPSAWNLAVNLVYYPAGRSRRSLASPYRPLFDVADNGTMVRSLAPSSSP